MMIKREDGDQNERYEVSGDYFQGRRRVPSNNTAARF